jgi:hypothetical protein
MGSTVILLFAPQRASWDACMTPGAELRFGQRIGGATTAV